MEKTIISYASGGLGNILLPLASCKLIAKKTNRKLIVCWEPTFACMATFQDLFEEDVQVITKNELINFKDVKIYGDLHDISFDSSLFENNSLNSLKSKFLTLPVPNFNLNDSEQNVIVYHNNILPSLDRNEVIQEFKNFTWNKDFLIKINQLVSELHIDANVIGAHVRGTDFSEGIQEYANAISSILHFQKDKKIFLCSDSEEWENKLLEMFPNNIIIRPKKASVVKRNENIDTWSNNILRSTDSVMEAVIDMHLLSKTSFMIYNKNSSFSQMITHLI